MYKYKTLRVNVRRVTPATTEARMSEEHVIHLHVQIHPSITTTDWPNNQSATTFQSDKRVLHTTNYYTHSTIRQTFSSFLTNRGKLLILSPLK
jgi:hypothetical protein